MGKLILTGDTKVLEQIAKSIRLKAKRNNISVSLKSKKPEDSNSSNDDKKLHYKTVISSINAVETLEDLKVFESDDRDAVKVAYAEKLKELKPE